MNEKSFKRYLEYASTEEACALLFVKKHLAQARGQWVDVNDCQRYAIPANSLHFRLVVGGLFNRRLQPHYPPKSEYTIAGAFKEREYNLMERAII